MYHTKKLFITHTVNLLQLCLGLQRKLFPPDWLAMKEKPETSLFIIQMKDYFNCNLIFGGTKLHSSYS